MDKIYQDYLCRHKQWERICSESQKTLDNWIITLSLVLFILFFKKSSVVSILNILSIFFILLSFFLAKCNAQKKIETIKKNYTDAINFKTPYKHDVLNDNIFQKATSFSNIVSIVLFVFSFIFAVITL